MDAIYTMNSDGSNKKMLNGMTGNNDDPSWNQTGTKIIFINQKTDDAIYAIFMMNADGTSIKKVVSTSSDELSPIFASK